MWNINKSLGRTSASTPSTWDILKKLPEIVRLENIYQAFMLIFLFFIQNLAIAFLQDVDWDFCTANREVWGHTRTNKICSAANAIFHTNDNHSVLVKENFQFSSAFHCTKLHSLAQSSISLLDSVCKLELYHSEMSYSIGSVQQKMNCKNEILCTGSDK